MLGKAAGFMTRTLKIVEDCIQLQQLAFVLEVAIRLQKDGSRASEGRKEKNRGKGYCS